MKETFFLTLKMPKMKTVWFFQRLLKSAKIESIKDANSVDQDEVAHHELPHLDLLFLHCNVWIVSMTWMKRFWNKSDL